MHDLKLRFTGTSTLASSDPYQPSMEVLELTFGNSRYNVAIPPSYRGFYDPTNCRGSQETCAERNSRLRYAASEMGHMLTQTVLGKLREMGHAV